MLSGIYFEHYPYMEQISAPGGQIDRLAGQYDAVFRRNYADAGWKITKVYNNLMRKPDSTYEKNLAFFRNFLSKRNEWLSEYYGVPDRSQAGDINFDSAVNASDAALILMASARIGTGESDGLSDMQRSVADVNADAAINASDASIVLIRTAAHGAAASEG